MKKKITNFIGSPWGQRLTILVIIAIVMAFVEPKFFTGGNWSSILLAIAFYGIMTCGMIFPVLVGGMDLSMGSMAAFAGSILAMMTVSGGYSNASFFKGALIAIAACVVFGTLHGLLVTYAKLPAFVVTLATKNLIYGIVLLVTNSSYIYLTEYHGLTYQIGNYRVANIPLPIIIFLVCVVISALVLNCTVYGRRMYAVGGNTKASELVGIKSKLNIIVAFIISSVSAGIAGMILISKNMVAGSGTASGYEGDVLMAIIVGGINLAGGEGGVMGAVFGALLVGIITNVQTLIGVPADYKDFVKGLVILAALALNIYTQRRSAGLISPRRRRNRLPDPANK